MKARVEVTLFHADGVMIGSAAEYVEVERGRVGWAAGVHTVGLAAQEAMSHAGSGLFEVPEAERETDG